MLSRSSSAYQPLEKECSSRRGSLEAVHKADDATQGTEMTSIAVISNHPFRSNTVTTTAVPANGSGGGGGHNHPPHHDLDFALCGAEEKTQWTNFHFIMCVGIGGFFIFWILLLSRMYLPPHLQFWRSDFDVGVLGFGGGGGEEETTAAADPGLIVSTLSPQIAGDSDLFSDSSN